MNFPISNTIFIAIIGFLLLYSYKFFSSKDPSIVEHLWGSIKGNLRKFYFISIGICFIAYFFIFIYLFKTNKLNNDLIFKITIAISGMILSSILWMPVSIIYYKNRSMLLKIMVIFILLLVSLFAFYLIKLLKDINENTIYHKLALYGSMYFFFQVFILDFIYWNYAFLYNS